MKIKLTLALFTLLIVSLSSRAQLSTLINNFKPAYAKGDVKNYIRDAEYLISNLQPEERNAGKRILNLFKVLTSNEQDITIIDFNKAMYEVGMSSILLKNINADLTLISISEGTYRSYMVLNQSKKLYKFSLKGLFKTNTRTNTNNFDGGIYEYRCRIVQYTTISYTYSVASVSEIPTVF